eukprot:4541561-Prymnesium_polylepis.1
MLVALRSHEQAALRSIGIGSHKANVGHSEGPSGLIGCVAAVHTLLHRAAAGNAQLRAVNRLIAKAVPPAAVSVGLWTHGLPLAELTLRGVTAFGASGIIGHALFSWLKGESERRPTGVTFRRARFPWKRPERVDQPQRSDDDATAGACSGESSWARQLGALAASQRGAVVESL